MDLLADLNEPQREAVLHDGGPLLILAGAGSGKTRVITRRIAHLVQERGVEPWRVLAVTFTNKAAKEMKERLVKALGPRAQQATVSTFHSASAMLLRREAERAGLSKSFVIYDDDDQLKLVKRAVRELGVELSQVSPRDLLSRIDAEKNAGRQPDEMKVTPDPRSILSQKVYRAYQKLLRNSDAVDFGDLLLLLVDLLKRDGELRFKYQRRFAHVMVDEFQDTNPVQYQLLKLLSPPGSNLAVVGDDDQSIYRWRGADVDNILGFPKDYGNTKVVKLEQNYRSDQNILEAAHAVIAKNRRRMDKKLWSERPKGEHLQVLIHRDERGEAQEVARRLHELKNQGITDFSSMAVFYRTNAQSRVIEEALRLMRVPYQLISGRSFYDRAEVRDAASYLRLMVNPKSDADLLRIINVPARGIGDTTVDRVSEYAATRGLSLFDALEWPERIEGLNSGAVKRLIAFRQLADKLVAAGKDAANATDPTKHMLEQSGLVSALKAEGTEEAMGRAENLLELLTATREFDKQREASAPAPAPVQPERSEPESKGQEVAAAPVDPDSEPLALVAPPLQAFLEQISLVGEADGESEEGRVSVMTLHAAKGLEFDAVFITGMEEDIFPHKRATGPDAVEEDMAEERRLCYVGFTRARRRLFVSLAQQRTLFGELRMNAPSRFLSEVPRELVDFPQEVFAPARPQPPRRRYGSSDEGPVIDRSYDQSTDFHQDSGQSDVRGLRVNHSQFGRGVILEAAGKGPNAKLTVQFETGAVKTIIARFLTPL